MSIQQDWETLVLKSLKKDWRELIPHESGSVETQPFYGPSSPDIQFVSTNLSTTFSQICPNAESIWTSEFQKYPGAALQISEPDHWNPSFEGVSELFVSGSFWWHQNTLKPWLESFPGDIRLNLGWDPWRIGLHQGLMSRWDDAEFPIQIFTESERPQVRAFMLSSELYALAGGSAVHELAVLLASAVESCRFFQDRLPTERLLEHFAFELTGDTDPLWTAAKIQSLKLLWNRILETFGQEPQNDTPIYVCPSVRNFSTREPWNNLIRLTLMQAGSFLGGASGFRHYPYDVFSKDSREHGRLSRNIGLILQSESGLGYVHNPLEGAGVMTHWLDQLCEQAWTAFQEIEKKGGLVPTLQSGWLQAEIFKSHQEEQLEIRENRKAIVGVNRFVGLEGLSPKFPFVSKNRSVSIEDWWEDRVETPKMKKEFRVKPVVPSRPLQIFEDFQMECDRLSQGNEPRPTVLIFCKNIKKQKLKIQNLRNMLAVAGVAAEVKDTVEGSASPMVCCLGTDPDAEHWPETVSAFRDLEYKKIIWYGERHHSFFDSHWSPQTNLVAVCEAVHETLGGMR